jgi:hypothetical protein
MQLHENYHFTYSAFGFGNKTALIKSVWLVGCCDSHFRHPAAAALRWMLANNGRSVSRPLMSEA